jgi:hypothetical protein
MQPRNQAVRKSKQADVPAPEPDRPPRALLSVRTALVLTVAMLAAVGGAVLLYAAHRPVALIVLGAVSIFAGALKLLDSLIELGIPGLLFPGGILTRGCARLCRPRTEHGAGRRAADSSLGVGPRVPPPPDRLVRPQRPTCCGRMLGSSQS